MQEQCTEHGSSQVLDFRIQLHHNLIKSEQQLVLFSRIWIGFSAISLKQFGYLIFRVAMLNTTSNTVTIQKRVTIFTSWYPFT